MATRQDFDLTREQAPNPAWLREFASTVKLEAQVLEGHIGDALVQSIMDSGPGQQVVDAVNVAMKATQAHAMLSVASDSLLELADMLDPGGSSMVDDSARPSAQGDPRGDADR